MWCGPYALAVCLGYTDYDYMYRNVQKILKRTHRPLRGMHNWEVERVLERHGARNVVFQFLKDHVKLQQHAWPTLRNVADYLKPNRLYIVEVRKHYVVVDTSDWTVTDNCRKGWWPLAYHRCASRKVVRVAEVKKVYREQAAA
jgi:hypothetical protein